MASLGDMVGWTMTCPRLPLCMGVPHPPGQIGAEPLSPTYNCCGFMGAAFLDPVTL